MKLSEDAYKISQFFTKKVEFIKGVGPKMAVLLKKKSIYSVGDSLHNLPKKYHVYKVTYRYTDLEDGGFVKTQGVVLSVNSQNMWKGKGSSEIVIQDGQRSQLRLKFFRVPFKGFFSQFQSGDVVRVSGQVKRFAGRFELHHPDIFKGELQDSNQVEVVPVYSETKGLSSKKISNIVREVFKNWRENENQNYDWLPEWIKQDLKFENIFETLEGLHCHSDVNNPTTLEAFYGRLCFEEFFKILLWSKLEKRSHSESKGNSWGIQDNEIQPLLKSLPFKLTDSQQSCLAELIEEYNKPTPSLRMIQGDVGSGKTIIAFLLSMVAWQKEIGQVVLLAPTVVLAEQHFLSLKCFFPHLFQKTVLLTGKTPMAERRWIDENLFNGEIQMVIGTHAVLEDWVRFKNLELIVIDEQHRFGVNQRLKLKNKGQMAHFLTMSATPIPRSLAMTLYGDLDISTLKSLPKGRLPIKTAIRPSSHWLKIKEFILAQIAEGRQAYVICPLIKKNEEFEHLSNATDEWKRLKKEFKEFKIGLMHGKLTDGEKLSIMSDFKENKTQILVSTSVVEVGVDVPNANFILIHNPEQFGLAQLHQLRGRVGRGEFQSYCALYALRGLSKEARGRLEFFTQTLDGFKISEYDLEQRGPGEFLGSQQAGKEGFQFANPLKDGELLKKAKSLSEQWIEKDQPEFKEINEYLSVSSKTNGESHLV